MRLRLSVLLAMMLMIGCTKQSSEPARALKGDDPYAELRFNLQYITVLNNDTAAIFRCTSEELKTGNDRGPICRQACATGDLLIKFEQDNPALMLSTHSRPSHQHRWCGKHK